jgi:hypothetical protein
MLMGKEKKKDDMRRESRKYIYAGGEGGVERAH